MRWEEFARVCPEFAGLGEARGGLAWHPERGLRRWELSH